MPIWDETSLSAKLNMILLTLYITLAGDWQIFISDGHLGDWLGFELFEFIRKESITFALSLGIAEL